MCMYGVYVWCVLHLQYAYPVIPLSRYPLIPLYSYPLICLSPHPLIFLSPCMLIPLSPYPLIPPTSKLICCLLKVVEKHDEQELVVC